MPKLLYNFNRFQGGVQKMKHNFKIFKLFSLAFIILFALIIPAFADDPPNSGDDSGTIIGEMEMTDLEDILGENGTPQTSDTILQTYVPARVVLDIGKNGSVKHNKITYKKSASFETMTLIFYIMPEKGYEIESVYWNGKDVTKLVSNGLLKIKDFEDGTLKVQFKLISKKDHKEKENNEENGEEQQSKTQQKVVHHIKTSDETKKKSLIYIFIAVICLICIALTLIKKKKMHYLRKK